MTTLSTLSNPAPLSLRRPVSHRSSASFFHLVDAIARHHEPTEAQLAALESSYQSTGEFLVSCPELNGLLLEIHAQGSRQLGTIIRPRDDSREGFDIDLVARLDRQALTRYGGSSGPSALLNHLHSALERYSRAHRLQIHRWERCVTLEYAGGMFADITPVIDAPLLATPYGDTHGRVPDRKLHSYEPTNPRGYAKSFDKAAAIPPVFVAALSFSEAMDSLAKSDIEPLPSTEEVFNRLLSRIVQLLKLHRNVSFGPSSTEQDAAPTSVFITTLAAMAYTAHAPQPHNGPLDLLLDIVEALPSYFVRFPEGNGSERWYLSNPSAPHDNLADSMNSAARQAGFHWWQRRLVKHLNEILEAIETNAGMDVLLARVETAFGKRAASGIRNEQSKQRAISRQAGRVTLVTPTASVVTTQSRPHTFFGC